MTRVSNSPPKSGWIWTCPACGTVHPGSWPKGPAFCPQCPIPLHRMFLLIPGVLCKIWFRVRIVDATATLRRIVSRRQIGPQLWHSRQKVASLSASAMVGPRPRRSRSRPHGSLAIGIPPQGETAALLRGGYREWRDLFPPRQLSAIERAVSLVNRERQWRLLFVIAYCSRWVGSAEYGRICLPLGP